MKKAGLGRGWGAIGVALAVVLVTGCGSSLTPILDCEAASGLVPDCRFTNPEDLVVTPDGNRLIVSEMRSTGAAGRLVLLDPQSGSIEQIYPADPGAASQTDWGDAECGAPEADAFAPHGIDLVRREDGAWMLLVVNHGGRESVEFFEVREVGERLDLRWRGCAEGPQQAAFNDVAARRDGGFYVTHMYPSDQADRSMLQGALFGMDTGFVQSWDASTGWRPVPGSDGPFPNGIALAPDEGALFINMYLAGEVRKLDLASGEVVAIAELGAPDNSSWAADGRLLVATHVDGLAETSACMALEAGSCGFGFSVVALDPQQLTQTELFTHRGAPMGGATVAVELGDRIWLGTFAGDRVASFRPHAAE